MTWDQGREAQRPFAVVGVARDGKYGSLGEDPKPFVFYPQSQLYSAEMAVVVRAQGDPKALAATLRREVKALDATLPVYDVKTLTAHLGTALFPARAAATLVGLSGSLALLLAAIGLYGVLSYAVSLRTREIGVRVALGAQRQDVVSLVVGRGLKLAGLGAGLGLALAFGLTRFLSFLLYGVSALDPVTFVGRAGAAARSRRRRRLGARAARAAHRPGRLAARGLAADSSRAPRPVEKRGSRRYVEAARFPKSREGKWPSRDSP